MTALAIPKEYGGAGLDLLTVSMITEELSKGCAGVATICMANALASYPVLIAGTEEQKAVFAILLIMVELPLLHLQNQARVPMRVQ